MDKQTIIIIVCLSTIHLKSTAGACSTFVCAFWIELEFGSVGFVERGKPENLEKNLSGQGENQQQTLPTCDARSRNQTQVTLGGGERSLHCATPAL